MLYRFEARYYNALRKEMTQSLPPRGPYPRLAAWARRADWLVGAVYSAAEAVGLGEAARRAVVLHVDRRDVSMETILAAIRYHARSEYPFLLRELNPHNTTALHATNLNDRYLILRLSQEERVQVEPLRGAIEALRTHLDNIPPEEAN